MLGCLRLHITIAASLWLCTVDSAASATPLRFFAVDHTAGPNTLYHFADDGTLLDTWPAPQSQFAYSLTTIGSSLYVAEYSGGIHEYALDGSYVREVAAINHPGGSAFQKIESDISGNLYTSFISRPAYKLDREGNLLTTYTHPGIWYSFGIDAAANGDVYILGIDSGDVKKLHRFQADGSFVGSHAIPQMVHISSMAIDESRNVLYVCSEFESSIFRYDISSGEPVFGGTLPAISRITKIFVEQQSGRIFTGGGFEVALDGSGANRIFTAPWHTMAVVAIPVPEPGVVAMLPFALTTALAKRCRQGRKQ